LPRRLYRKALYAVLTVLYWPHERSWIHHFSEKYYIWRWLWLRCEWWSGWCEFEFHSLCCDTRTEWTQQITVYIHPRHIVFNQVWCDVLVNQVGEVQYFNGHSSWAYCVEKPPFCCIHFSLGNLVYVILTINIMWYGDSARNTVDENSSIFSLIRMR